MIHFQEYFLKNHLKLIVHEDPSVQTAVVNILYDVGSRDENPQKTGFAHLFEHLMFGGSKNIPDYDTALQKVGGQNNAFTSPDITNYYITLPYQNLETAFWLESDRMKELAFSPKSLEVQRKVVIEEFKQRYLNQPYGDAWLKFRPLAYQVHPYRWATIGEKIEHIENASLADVKDFFYTHYVPANATIVVAGRVKFKEVVSLVEKWFGDIPSGRKPQRNLPQEPSQKDHRKEIVETDVPANSIMLGIPMVERTHPAYHAIDLLSDLLGRGDSSFLNQRLVEQARLFSSISAYVMGSLDPGLMMIQGYVSDGISPEEAENTLLENLAEFSKLNVEERNLEKVKNQAESSLAFGEVELLNKAMNIAFSSNMGNTNWVNQESEKIQAVTVEDIQDWSNKLIKQVGRNTLVYKKLG